MPVTDSSSPARRIRAAIYLILFALSAAVFLSWAERFTHQRIADNELAMRLKMLRSVLPADAYDNELHLDLVHVLDPGLLGSRDPVPVYRARKDQQPVAAVLTAVAWNGFSGQIRLLVSIYATGEVGGVRVIEHKETPGLGDAIEVEKSDWIRLFTGLDISKLLTDTLATEWTLDRDGGSFDHITGATVTSRAVVNAVRNAVIYFNTHRAEIFAAPAEVQDDNNW